jgi:hypothetical protein
VTCELTRVCASFRWISYQADSHCGDMALLARCRPNVMAKFSPANVKGESVMKHLSAHPFELIQMRLIGPLCLTVDMQVGNMTLTSTSAK